MFYQQELSFGLDIGDRSLKIMQFRVSRGKTILAGFAELDIPPGLLKAGEIIQPRELIAAIKQIRKQANITSDRVLAALPESKTFIKLLSIPAVSPDQSLETLIQNELQKHLPYDISEVWWDFAVVGQTETKTDILAGAAPKTIIASYARLLEDAGLTVIALDLEPLAVARAVIQDNPKPGCHLTVDIGAVKSTLIFANNKTVLATADGKTSGDELTQKIADVYKIEIAAAEEMKQKYGVSGGDSPKYQQIIQDYISRLARRVQDALEFATNHEISCSGINDILLVGGGALLSGLPEHLSTALKIPVRLADPWINTRDTINQKIDQKTGLRLATACGLAIAALSYDHRQ